ncbi:MAG: efflux RND transporter periplasmic adaptor subunit [Planctomyces sp.]
MLLHARFTRLLSRAVWLLVACLGCSNPESAAPAKPPVPEVTVAVPQSLEVQDYQYFTGRVEPNERVDVRARVSGHLTSGPFRPGSEIAAGDILAEVDKRPFEAELARVQAQLAEAEARAARTQGTFERITAAREKGAASEEEFRKALGDRDESAAAVQLVKAALSLAQLNLDYCTLRSPIAGRIGDRLVDAGNLVTGGPTGATLLTTVVSVDPLQVAFDMDENTLQRLQQAMRDGRLPSPQELSVPVQAGLAIHQGDYPLSGTVKFLNNQVDPSTGTIRLKAEFQNPKLDPGGRVLAVGMFVRVRVPIGPLRSAVLVPESALASEQGQRYLFIVDDQQTARRLNVEPGLQLNGLREIARAWTPGSSDNRGLLSTDRVIVKGLQRVRNGAAVATVDQHVAKQ